MNLSLDKTCPGKKSFMKDKIEKSVARISRTMISPETQLKFLTDTSFSVIDGASLNAERRNDLNLFHTVEITI